MRQSTFGTPEDARRAASDALSADAVNGAGDSRVSELPPPDPNAEENAKERVAEVLRQAKMEWGETPESDVD